MFDPPMKSMVVQSEGPKPQAESIRLVVIQVATGKAIKAMTTKRANSSTAESRLGSLKKGCCIRLSAD